MTFRFRDTRLSKNRKIRNAPNDLKRILKTQQSKYLTYTKYLPLNPAPEAQILVHFALQPAVCQKRLLKIGNTPNNPLYTLNSYPCGPNLGPFWFKAAVFKISPISYFPIDYHGKRKKSAKFQISLFFEQLWESPFPVLYMNFAEQIWCVLSEEMSFETFTPIWSPVNKNEKKS